MSGTRLFSRSLMIMAALVLAAVTAPAAAFYDSALPQLSSDPLADHGAASYRLTVPDHADVEIFVDAVHAGATFSGEGIWFYDSAGMGIGWVTTAFDDGVREVHLEMPDPVGILYEVKPVPPEDREHGIGLLLFDVPAGTYRVVAGSVSDGALESGAVSLRATEGSRIIERKVSRGGFAYGESHFRGLNVVVGTGLVRPVVMAGATLPLTIDRSLYGWFGTFFDVVTRLTVDGPNGSSTKPMHFFDASEPGPYEFTVDAEVGLPDGRLWLWGLDVDTV